MKKICILTHDDWDEATGVARMLQEIAPRLAGTFSVTVISTTAKQFRSQTQNSSLELIQLPARKLFWGALQIPDFPKILKEKLLAADLVFIQTIENAQAIRFALRHQKPLVLYFHGLDWELFANSLKMGPLSKPVLWLMWALWKHCYRRANHICLPSADFNSFLKDASITAPSSVVPAGIDTQKFKKSSNQKELRQKLKLQDSDFVIGYVGRLAPEKNIKLLFKIFLALHQKNDRCRLLVVGSGDPADELLLKSHPNILTVGYQSDVTPYLQVMDAFCLTSISETSSLVTLEAMACEVVPVVHAIGCMRGYIQSGKNGFLVDRLNSEAEFIRHLEFLREHPAARAEMGRAARHAMEEYFSWEETVRKLATVFDGVLETVGAGSSRPFTRQKNKGAGEPRPYGVFNTLPETHPAHPYTAIFISPHLDDAVFSCGGQIAKFAKQGRVLVINIFTDYGKKTAARKQEELKAAEKLGYETLFLDFPDFPLRERFGFLAFVRHRKLTERDGLWIQAVGGQLQKILGALEFERIYFPLGIGLHRDHQICFEVAAKLFASDSRLWFYEDLPYAMHTKSFLTRFEQIGHTLTEHLETIAEEFEQKLTGVLCYKSQWRGFFYSKKRMRRLYKHFHQPIHSNTLAERSWKIPPQSAR